MKRKNEGELFEVLNNLLTSLNLSLSVKEKTTEFQALQIVTTIMNDYPHLSVEDVALCFKMGKTGRFGPTYNKLDVQVIGEWLSKYIGSDEYNDYLENRHKMGGPTIDEDYKPHPGVKALVEKMIHKIRVDELERKKVGVTDEKFLMQLAYYSVHYSDNELNAMEEYYKEKDCKDGLEIIINEKNRRVTK